MAPLTSGSPMRQPASEGDSIHRVADYRPDIDGLRAVAIIPVVIFHAFPGLLPGGFVGVDIFFVISGFLISGIILRGLQRGNFSFPGFYANRIRRIFPALLVVLIACCVCGWFFLFPGEYAQLGKHVVGGAGYVENLVLWREAGYFDAKSYMKPLMHLWSLGIEEQFYLTYPLLLWLLWRWRCNLMAVLIPLILISFSWNVAMVRGDAAGAFFLPQSRFWELWIGGVLAYANILPRDALPVSLKDVSRKDDRATSRFAIRANLFSGLGALFIVAALFVVRERAFPGWWALVPVVGASLLIVGGPTAWINRRILSAKPAVFVGLVSYPLYLWHWPILSFLRILRGEQPAWTMRLAAAVLSFVLAWATWRFVESPLRFGRKTWMKPAALLALSVLVILAGLDIHRNDGFGRRFKSISQDFGWEHPEVYFTADCRKTLGADNLDYCRSLRPGSPDVLLIGDSHAAALYRALAPAYASRSQTLMNLGAPGCAPFYDTESYALGMRGERDCRRLVNRVLDFATSTASVQTIILAVRGAMDMSDHDFGDDANGAPEVIAWKGAPQGSSNAEVFAAAFRNTVGHLTAANKNVILFLDWPELGFDPRTCLPRPVRIFSQLRPLCGVPRAQVDQRNRQFRNTVFEIAKEFPKVTVFDPFPYLCDSAACYAMRDGHLLYRDDNHVSAQGAEYLGAKFMQNFPGERNRPFN